MMLEDKDLIEMIRINLEKAEEAYEDAILLLKPRESRRGYNGVANRAYYAMLHAEKALLLTRGILGEKHKHVHTQLSNQFVKEGKLPSDTARNIDYVQEIRHVADYSDNRSATKEEVEAALSKTKSFMEQAKELLQASLPEQGENR